MTLALVAWTVGVLALVATLLGAAVFSVRGRPARKRERRPQMRVMSGSNADGSAA